MGISIDQHLKNKLQADPATQTRFGSLEFGVMVPDRADTWTRMSYAGPNQPVAPISDPYQMFDKLYGQTKNRQLLASVLDDLSEDFSKVQKMVSSEDRRILDEHLADGSHRRTGTESGTGSQRGRETTQAMPSRNCRRISTKTTTTCRKSAACRSS